jgi:hypothetical protein
MKALPSSLTALISLTLAMNVAQADTEVPTQAIQKIDETPASPANPVEISPAEATPPKAASPAGAQANNPLANFTALNFQNYYIGEFTGADDSKKDTTGDQFWLRFAKPFSVGESNWLLRASLPVNHFPTAPNGDKKTGVGDLNIILPYIIDIGKPGVSFGIGPQFTLPTGASDLGSEKWSAGLVNMLFDASSSKFQYGYLLTWQHSVAGDDNRATVNAAGFQPFAYYQLGKGLYLRSAPMWSYNLDNKTYAIPMSLGIGQVIPTPKVVYNVFIEPQYLVADKGEGWAKWQIFMGVNLQFKNK